MKVLIACEESQTITKAFRKLNIEAYSCDIKECSGGHPDWHIKGDAIIEAYTGKYDLMIAHPPCTYLAVSGSRWLYHRDGTKNIDRWIKREAALNFVKKLMDAPIKHIAIENPVSVISSQIKKPDQIVQPYFFGDEAQKTTCLWLQNLPPLKHTNVVKPGQKIGKNKQQKWYVDALKAKTPEERRTIRSKTFEGMAEAIASQWSMYILGSV